jgi:hypothetical protein
MISRRELAFARTLAYPWFINESGGSERQTWRRGGSAKPE